MAVNRPRPATARPFVTRRSTLAFSAACVLAGAILQALGGSGGPGASGAAVAVIASIALVTGVVAWIAGVVLAVRAGSVLWTVVAALPIPPINSMVCAMFCPAARSER